MSDYLSTLPPNLVKCKCGNVFTISQKVQKRPLDCIKCGRYYQYRRELGNKWSIKLMGTFKSAEEREVRNGFYAVDRIYS